MDISGVERYILLGYDSKKAASYKLKSRLFGFSVFWCLAAALTLIGILEIRLHSSPDSIFGYTLQFGLHPVTYIITGMLICFVALLVGKNSNRMINRLAGSFDEVASLQEKHKNKRNLNAATLVVLGVASVSSARLSETISEHHPELHWALFIVFAMLLVLFMLFYSFTYPNKYYLLKKYCPYLKYYHDGRYLLEE